MCGSADEWGTSEAIVPDEVGVEAYTRSVDALRYSLDVLLSEDWVEKRQWKQVSPSPVC